MASRQSNSGLWNLFGVRLILMKPLVYQKPRVSLASWFVVTAHALHLRCVRGEAFFILLNSLNLEERCQGVRAPVRSTVPHTLLTHRLV